MKVKNLSSKNLDTVLHTVVYQSSTSIYKRNFVESGRTDGRTDRSNLFGQLGGVDLKIRGSHWGLPLPQCLSRICSICNAMQHLQLCGGRRTCRKP